MNSRKGYILLAVLGIVILLSLGVATLAKFTVTETRTITDSFYSRKAYEIARSGIEVGLLKFKKEETCGWKIEEDFDGGKFVVESSGSPENCRLVSYGYYKGAVRRIEIGSSLRSLAAFVVNKLRVFDSFDFSPKIENADFLIGSDAFVDGSMGDDAIDVLKSQGFKARKEKGHYPAYPLISIPSYTGSVPSYQREKVTPPPFPKTCDVTIDTDTYYLWKIDSSGKMDLLNKVSGKHEYVNLKDVNVLCGKGNDRLEIAKGITIGKSWINSDDPRLVIYSPRGIVVWGKISVVNDYYSYFDLQVLSKGYIGINKLDVPSLSVNDKFNLTIYTPEKVEVPSLSINGLSSSKGDFTLNIIPGEVGIVDLNVKNVNTPQGKMIVNINSDKLGIQNLNIEGFSSEKGIEIKLEGNEVNVGSFSFKNGSVNSLTDFKVISRGYSGVGSLVVSGVSSKATNFVMYGGDSEFDKFSIKNGNLGNLGLTLVPWRELGFNNLSIEGISANNLRVLMHAPKVEWKKFTVKNSQIDGDVDLDFAGSSIAYERFDLEGIGVRKNLQVGFYSSDSLTAVDVNVENSRIDGNFGLIFAISTPIGITGYETKIGQINIEGTSMRNFDLYLLNAKDLAFFEDGVDFQKNQVTENANFVVYNRDGDIFVKENLYRIKNSTFRNSPNVFLIAGGSVGWGYESLPTSVEDLFGSMEAHPEYASLYMNVLMKDIVNKFFTKDTGQLLKFEKNTHGVNFVTWLRPESRGNIVSPGGIDIKDVNSESRLALWTQGNLYLGDFTYFGTEPPKGLTIDDVAEFCKETFGMVRDLYCFMSASGIGNETIKVSSWLVD